ncbi:Cytoplasmic dynein 1 heavy chain 1 [Malassezia restricta CBS 7877]|uniref:Dynein heavy chain, cytoplasmic n=1 Tax=Malassezia restricta (strain ATCC 96810 / NBRC 103918 / CBS 7877) TaxID=425264 RepID=A0A3G2S841_MALR7|nr:Cytoplasmic dynein 1 heavy chain 1 [Malassezia restricta CBS 7877]
MGAPLRVRADTTGDWSEEACRTVAYELTSSLDLGEHRNALVDTMVWIHMVAADLGERVRAWTGRQYHPSPQHLLSLLHSFSAIVREQHEQHEDQQRFRLMGLDKLRATVEQIEEMQSLLSTKRKRLEDANSEANDRLHCMVEQQQVAESKREASLALQTELQRQEAAMAQQRASVLQELSEAEPALLDAQAAVSNIKKQHLSEVRSMTNPPSPVKLAMESVCILLGHRVDGWKSVQSLIRRDDFISTVVHLDTAHIPQALRERLQREYLDRPEYNIDSIYRASSACGPLARWVLAQIHYAHILESVGPLRAQVQILEEQASLTRQEAIKADATVAELEESIDSFKREYASLISETQALSNEMHTVEARVARSVRLLDGLSSERERWEHGREAFDAQVKTLPGDALLCAAMITYAGFFDQACREALWYAWVARLGSCNVPVRAALSFADTLSTADERAAWQNLGLRSDSLSIENAVMLQRCTRVPLLIDPSGRAVSFAQGLFAHAQPAITSFLDGGFAQVLERALRFGMPLIITDAEYFDPILMPVLNAEKRRTGGRLLVRVGTSDVDWAPSFRLILATRYAGLVLAPHVFARVQVINFTITRKSLEAQSLARILHHERADIEQQRVDLERMQSEFQRRLLRLEQSLLTALNEAQGHILDDDHVVSTLETLKAEADDVTQKVQATGDIMTTVQQATEAYVPLASACSALYFLLEHMQELHPFYSFDMRLFERLLQDVLSHPTATDSENDRCDALYDELFISTFFRAAPTLLHADALVLAVALAQVYCLAGRRAGELDGADFHALLYGTDTPTLRLVEHEKLAHPEAWHAWTMQVAPELADVPLTPLSSDTENLVRQALIVRTLRPDRLAPALTRLVHHIFGTPLLDAAPPTIHDIVEQVSSDSPLAMCGVAGYDASGIVEACAVSKQMTCAEVALGSPEAIGMADRAIISAARSGSWVLIKNAHLAPVWLAQLPSRLTSQKPHERCRIFLTCELSPSVPPSFIRAARIVMHEPPAGCKAILLDALHALDSRPASNTDKAPPERERVYFLVALLHAIVLERARHAPLGWSHAYEFYDTDLEAAYAIVDTCMASAAQSRRNLAPEVIPWPALRALLAQNVYGSRMDSDADRHMLDALLAHLFIPAAFERDFVIAPNDVQPLIAPEGLHREQLCAWASSLPEPQPVHWVLLAPEAERATAVQNATRILRHLQILRQLAGREQDIIVDHTRSDTAPAPPATSELAALVESHLSKVPRYTRTDTPSATDPLGRFWARERHMALSVSDTVYRDLERLADVLVHRAPRSSDVSDMLSCIEKDRVPAVWCTSSVPYGTSLCGWLTDLGARTQHAMQETHERVELGRLWAASAFLTATRQMTARHRHQSLEQLELQWHLGSKSVPGQMIWEIGPVWIDGGVWSKGQLHLNNGSSTCVSTSTLEWTIPADTIAQQLLHVPVFLDTQRQHLLCHAAIPIDSAAALDLAALRAVAIRLM